MPLLWMRSLRGSNLFPRRQNTSNFGAITMSRFADLKGYVDALEDDFSKFYDKGNKAAGTRVRKAMQDLKGMAQDIRVEVQNKKNG